MKLLEFALFSAAAPSSFAADVGHFEGAGDRASSRAAAGRRGDDTGAVVGGVRGGHARVSHRDDVFVSRHVRIDAPVVFSRQG